VKQTLVLYPSRHGHARHVAECLASVLQARWLPAEVHDAAHIPARFSLVCYSAHGGKHEVEAEAVRRVEQSKRTDVHSSSPSRGGEDNRVTASSPSPQSGPGVLSYVELQTFFLHREPERVIFATLVVFALIKARRESISRVRQLCSGK
jgi:hypothetical protein